jgi:3-isopropylmalate/(R)-2-methylmalate dehydratase small subunit
MAPATSRIERVAGRAIVLGGNDIDTDRIIPARFLKAITFDGLETHVFEDDRRELAVRNAVHPFDDPAVAGAAVLVVGANFGCGSSREHAPRALAQWGIGAVVGESFAEIFASNALTIGLPCVSAQPDAIRRLRELLAENPTTEVVVDLQTSSIAAGGVVLDAALPASARAALISGDWDATSLLLDRYEEVEATRARLPYGVRS